MGNEFDSMQFAANNQAESIEKQKEEKNIWIEEPKTYNCVVKKIGNEPKTLKSRLKGYSVWKTGYVTDNQDNVNPFLNRPDFTDKPFPRDSVTSKAPSEPSNLDIKEFSESYQEPKYEEPQNEESIKEEPQNEESIKEEPKNEDYDKLKAPKPKPISYVKEEGSVLPTLNHWNEEYGEYYPIEFEYDENGWKNYYDEYKDEQLFNFDKGEVKNTRKKIKLNEDEIYEGELNEYGEKHGQGTLITADGIKKGTWKNNKFEGWGVISTRANPKCGGKQSMIYENGKLADRQSIVQTRFIDGEANGKGTYEDAGHRFEGEFRDNKKYKGTEERYRDNSIYEGPFVDNKRDGKGKVTMKKDGYTYIYEGQFKKGRSTGNGTITWDFGSKGKNVYVGEVKDGKMNGKGKLTYANGREYEGEFNEGVKEGNGSYKMENGNIFKGSFLEGGQYGQGSLIVDGKEIEGKYTDGKFVPFEPVYEENP